MQLVLEMLEGASDYGHIHKAGCLHRPGDPEPIGSATNKTDANELAADVTGWRAEAYTFADCVTLPLC